MKKSVLIAMGLVTVALMSCSRHDLSNDYEIYSECGDDGVCGLLIQQITTESVHGVTLKKNIIKLGDDNIKYDVTWSADTGAFNATDSQLSDSGIDIMCPSGVCTNVSVPTGITGVPTQGTNVSVSGRLIIPKGWDRDISITKYITPSSSNVFTLNATCNEENDCSYVLQDSDGNPAPNSPTGKPYVWDFTGTDCNYNIISGGDSSAPNVDYLFSGTCTLTVTLPSDIAGTVENGTIENPSNGLPKTIEFLQFSSYSIFQLTQGFETTLGYSFVVNSGSCTSYFSYNPANVSHQMEVTFGNTVIAVRGAGTYELLSFVSCTSGTSITVSMDASAYGFTYAPLTATVP
jgi:hypothetical protein